jgi:C-terminal processing protease CtpA/Prc
MRFQNLLIPISTFALGWLGSTVFDGSHKPDSVGLEVRPQVTGREDNSALRADHEQRIAQLSRELLELKQATAASVAPTHEADRSNKAFPEGALNFIQQTLERGQVNLEKYERNKLVAAGFSASRIDLLRMRSAELKAESERRRSELRKSQPDMSMAYLMDPDLDLRNEIGDAEYDRYRQALGRDLGVMVQSVLGAADSSLAVIKAGDVIVGYAGKRVYNEPMMQAMAMPNPTAAYVTLDIVRKGQPMQVVIPGGRLALLSRDPMDARMQEMRSLREAANKP